MTFRTLSEALEDAAVSTRTGFRFVEEEGSAEPFFSYRGIERASARFGAAMQALGLGAGDRIALILPDNQDFVFAFLGAVRAGIIPVPMYPPTGLRKLSGYLESARHIVQRSGARLILTDVEIKRLLGQVQSTSRSLERVVAVETIRASRERLRPVKVGLDDPCFLQFTSGSTSQPKGVVVSHANVAANVDAFMRGGLRVEDGIDAGVSWLPLYHDMGLIGFVLAPLFHRNTVTLLPALTFLKRPVRWLQALSRHRGTISFGPNFAYALCVKRVRDRDLEGLDLSPWRVAGCGAEPIRAANLRAFAERFAPVGFDATAFLPSYGLAEATLAVTFDRRREGARVDRIDPQALASEAEAVATEDAHAREVVSCGSTFADHEVAIFAPEDRDSLSPLEERRVGEIRVRGPSVCAGYYNDPEQTAAAFAGGWLCTGDLGYLVDGELYVYGREKELVIVNGRNFYPQDLEWEASRIRDVRKGSVVAFGTTKPMGDRERVIIVLETSALRVEHPRIIESVRKSVQGATGLLVDDVACVAVGVLPKTSSGKLKRREVRRLYELGQLFVRPSERRTDPLQNALEIARSQIGYAKSALRYREPME
ncbi:MAG: fatty acyl-AMP ligase [Myxococcota bacterium]